MLYRSLHNKKTERAVSRKVPTVVISINHCIHTITAQFNCRIMSASQIMVRGCLPFTLTGCGSAHHTTYLALLPTSVHSQTDSTRRSRNRIDRTKHAFSSSHLRSLDIIFVDKQPPVIRGLRPLRHRSANVLNCSGKFHRLFRAFSETPWEGLRTDVVLTVNFKSVLDAWELR